VIIIKTIYYYTSDYGYASRSVVIIRELLALSEKVKMMVCRSYTIDFIKDSLSNISRVEYREIPTDIGYKLKQNSL
jgi:hypothetical protein